MRIAPIVVLAVLGASGVARADGLAASAAALADGGLRNSVVKLGVGGGSSGVWIVTGYSVGFEYASYDYAGRSLELGAGLRWNPIGPLQVFASGGAIIAPLGENSGGGRLSGGISARFGNRWFVRPGAALSFGLIGDKTPPTFLLPMEVSVEAGYTWPFISPYVRLSLGADPISGVLATAIGAASVGLSIPIGPTVDST